MAEPTIVVTDAPDPRDVEVIGRGLVVYNHEQTGIHDHKPLAVLVKDADDNTLGGISGRSSLGLLFLDLVYLPKTLRGGGLGQRLLAMAEAEGRKRGCKRAVLYTISFQAPEFYKKYGWRVFGEIPCDPRDQAHLHDQGTVNSPSSRPEREARSGETFPPRPAP